MTIDKSTISRIVRNIFRHSKGLTDHNLMHPEREWMAGFITTFIILISGIYGAWYTHSLYREKSTTENSTVPSTANIYRENEVKWALDLWAERKARYEAIKTELSAPTPLPPPAEAIITPPSTNNEDLNPDTPTPPAPTEPDTTSPNPPHNENPPPPQLEF